MKLRLRFALTAVAVMLPVVFALFWFNAGLHIAYRAAALHGFRLTLQRSEYGGLEVKLEGDLAPR
jgi:hypothetical protein